MEIDHSNIILRFYSCSKVLPEDIFVAGFIYRDRNGHGIMLVHSTMLIIGGLNSNILQYFTFSGAFIRIV